MKKFLLAATLAALPFGAHAADLAAVDAPAAAPASAGQISGFVEAAISGSHYEYWGDSYEPWTALAGAAAISYRLDDSLSVGLDVRASTAGDSSWDYNAYYNQAFAHLNWLSGTSSLGVFGGVVVTNGYYSDGADFNVAGGLEGKLAALDNVILSGQIGYLKNLHSYYPYDGAMFGQAAIAFFPLDNLKLEASLGFLTGHLGDDDGEDAKTVTYGLEAAYQLEGTPASIFARFTGYQDYAYWDDSDAGTGNTFSLGVRFNLDGESLKDQAIHVNQTQDFSALSWLRLDAW